MCKVLMTTGITDSKNALRFLKASQVPMSRVDNDGIGYLAVDSQGNMFSEKWHNNDDFMRKFSIDSVLRSIQDMIDENLGDYSSTGVVKRNDIKSFALHTRFATCGKEFNNTHPFVINDTGLIHNGIIRNSKELTNIISTCDSETILNEYLKFNVDINPDSIKLVTEMLQGYWALGIIGKDKSGVRYLDVLKDSQASLYVTSIKELGKNNITFCTSKDILTQTLKKLKWDSDIKIYKVKHNRMMRFNALTGEVISRHESTSGKLQSFVSNKMDDDSSFKSWTNGLGLVEEASDSKYATVSDDYFGFDSLEEYIDESDDWNLQSIYYDLPKNERDTLERMKIEDALDYLEEVKDEYVKLFASGKK